MDESCCSLKRRTMDPSIQHHGHSQRHPHHSRLEQSLPPNGSASHRGVAMWMWDGERTLLRARTSRP